MGTLNHIHLIPMGVARQLPPIQKKKNKNAYVLLRAENRDRGVRSEDEKTRRQRPSGKVRFFLIGAAT